MVILHGIWRYLDYKLYKDIIKCILEDKKNRNKLLLEIITVWYDGTTALNYDSIRELRRLGDDALEDLKTALKGGTNEKSRYLTYRRGKLDELSFRSDLQEYYYDFNYTIELIYSLFGTEELGIIPHINP
ncbi:hypothetical protein LCGC14_2163020 [marine sediment metagenome]|uniref:Uncharacterized protein n=1 Tax=marine sediment metagenome TaxID=412755 RepID=A0A0F9G4W2_9ZZZZ